MKTSVHFIGDSWHEGEGKPFQKINPCTGKKLWEGNASSVQQVERAVTFAEQGFQVWSKTSLEDRTAVLKKFIQELEASTVELTQSISQEIGKPLWEAQTEVRSMISKVSISIEAEKNRRTPQQRTQSGASVWTRYRPHGVLAVLGPFNFPGHLPNGHIVPALLAGNAIVFKPSEHAPLTSKLMVQAWHKAGLPPHVLQMVQGDKNTATTLLDQPLINGVLFTGSVQAGLAINQRFAGEPDKILALEMGGNNPLVVWEVSNIATAVYHTIQSAFITAGQRCTCARRLIVPRSPWGDQFLNALVDQTRKLVVAPPEHRPEPWCGAVISEASAQHLVKLQKAWIQQGGVEYLTLQQLTPKTGLVSPGIIDMSSVQSPADEEWFGPLLQVYRVPTFEEALARANATRFGLSAGLLSDSRELYQQFFNTIKAGVINWNQPLTGASSQAPFGGVGLSGNHRPSAYFATDYCSYSVASMESDKLTLPAELPPSYPQDHS